MASDLREHHFGYFHFVRHVTRPYINPLCPIDPSLRPPTPLPTVFIRLDSPSNVSHLRFCVHSAAEPAPPPVLFDSFRMWFGKCTIILATFDYSYVTWSLGSGVMGIKSLESYYELHLAIPPGKEVSTSPVTLASIRLRGLGYEVGQDREWVGRINPTLNLFMNKGEGLYTLKEIRTGQGIGYLTYLMHTGTGRVLITELGILEGHRRKGLGSGLVQHLQEIYGKGGLGKQSESQQMGIWAIVLCKYTGAVEMFIRNGYKVERSMWEIEFPAVDQNGQEATGVPAHG